MGSLLSAAQAAPQVVPLIPEYIWIDGDIFTLAEGVFPPKYVRYEGHPSQIPDRIPHFNWIDDQLVPV